MKHERLPIISFAFQYIYAPAQTLVSSYLFVEPGKVRRKSLTLLHVIDRWR